MSVVLLVLMHRLVFLRYFQSVTDVRQELPIIGEIMIICIPVGKQIMEENGEHLDLPLSQQHSTTDEEKNMTNTVMFGN